MSDAWKKYWASRPKNPNGALHDALIQVGKTRFGNPISLKQLSLLSKHIVEALGLCETDVALDLGCGNGLVTRMMASYVSQTIGVDYSSCLLATAREHFGGSNIVYTRLDLRNPRKFSLPSNVTCAWSIEVVQNLCPEDLLHLLEWLHQGLGPEFRLLLSGIPDYRKIRSFYNTPEQWEFYQRRKKAGEEHIGYWWKREEIMRCADRVGMRVTFLDLPSEYYTAHYRFDALLRSVVHNAGN